MLKVYTIRDTKSESYGLPFCKSTHGLAERDFIQLASDEKSTVSQFPEDYDLFYLGDYDQNTGKFVGLDAPQHIAKAIDVITKKQ